MRTSQPSISTAAFMLHLSSFFLYTTPCLTESSCTNFQAVQFLISGLSTHSLIMCIEICSVFCQQCLSWVSQNDSWALNTAQPDVQPDWGLTHCTASALRDRDRSKKLLSQDERWARSRSTEWILSLLMVSPHCAHSSFLLNTTHAPDWSMIQDEQEAESRSISCPVWGRKKVCLRCAAFNPTQQHPVTTQRDGLWEWGALKNQWWRTPWHYWVKCRCWRRCSVKSHPTNDHFSVSQHGVRGRMQSARGKPKIVQDKFGTGHLIKCWLKA